MKGWSRIVMCAILVGTFGLLVLPAEAGMVLKFNHTFVPGSPVDRASEIFAKSVNSHTKGELEVQVFKAAQLGDVLGT
ncbi:MAG: hypothetical protein NTY64_03155, partial [Deltaproteobacteria bacterium]|nr:hypothetical protein [Deltaproteobacteria bacterium]